MKILFTAETLSLHVFGSECMYECASGDDADTIEDAAENKKGDG